MNPLVTVSLQLLTVAIPEVAAIWKAIAALRQKGVAPADVTALLQAIDLNVATLEGDVVNTLAGIPLPKAP